MTVAWERTDLEICTHEAAHLVASCKLRLSTPHAATVEPGEDYAGRITDPGGYSPEVRRAIIRARPESEATCREWDEKRIIFLLAGMVAGDRTVFPTTASASEYHAETLAFLVDEAEERDDMERDLRQTVDILEIYESDPEKQKEWLFVLLDRAHRFVDDSWDDIRRVALFLQERRTLDRRGIFEAYEMIEAKEG